MIGVGLSLWQKQKVDTPIFALPLDGSLALKKGQGSLTNSRTSLATVTDFEEIVKTAKAEETRFEGHRRVENLVTYGEDFSNVAWSKTNETITSNTAIAPDGTTTADETLYYYPNVKIFDVTNFVFITNAIAYTPTTDWQRFAFTFTTPATCVSARVYIVRDDVAATKFIHQTVNVYQNTKYTFSFWAKRDAGSTKIYLWGAQLEEVAGQTNQNPSEYVSNNVLPFPYHGAGADGVKYFAYENGNTVAANVVTEAIGADISAATLKGALLEDTRANLLLQSAVPATQNVTVAAVPHTISMWGTGTCTLSGTGSGVLTGTGADVREELTFTPTAGTLTLTFAGTNTKGQLEAGSFASSYIETTTTAVTRAADNLLGTVAGNFDDTEGTVYLEALAKDWANATGQYLGDGTEAPLAALTTNSGVKSFDGTNTANGPTGTPSGWMKLACKWSGSTMKVFANGVAGAETTYDGAFSLSDLGIGLGFFGNIRNLTVYRKAHSDSLIISKTS